MKTKRHLAKYLTDYILEEMQDLDLIELHLMETLDEGLEAFESTKQVQIKIIEVID